MFSSVVGDLSPSTVGVHATVEPDGNPLLGLNGPTNLVVGNRDKGKAAGGAANTAQAVVATGSMFQRSTYQDPLRNLPRHVRKLERLWKQKIVLYLRTLSLILDYAEQI